MRQYMTRSGFIGCAYSSYAMHVLDTDVLFKQSSLLDWMNRMYTNAKLTVILYVHRRLDVTNTVPRVGMRYTQNDEIYNLCY